MTNVSPVTEKIVNVAKQNVNGKTIDLVGGVLPIQKVTQKGVQMVENLPGYLSHIANA